MRHEHRAATVPRIDSFIYIKSLIFLFIHAPSSYSAELHAEYNFFDLMNCRE